MRGEALFGNHAPQIEHSVAEEQPGDHAQGKGEDQAGEVRETGPAGEASGNIEEMRRGSREKPAHVRRARTSHEENTHPQKPGRAPQVEAGATGADGLDVDSKVEAALRILVAERLVDQPEKARPGLEGLQERDQEDAQGPDQRETGDHEDGLSSVGMH